VSKMNALSMDAREADYEDYVEYQRQELRKEGAEELRNEILRSLDSYIVTSSGHPATSYQLDHIIDMVKRAQI
jgi:uroporphyrinogen-III synthase